MKTDNLVNYIKLVVYRRHWLLGLSVVRSVRPMV